MQHITQKECFFINWPDHLFRIINVAYLFEVQENVHKEAPWNFLKDNSVANYFITQNIRQIFLQMDVCIWMTIFLLNYYIGRVYSNLSWLHQPFANGYACCTTYTCTYTKILFMSSLFHDKFCPWWVTDPNANICSESPFDLFNYICLRCTIHIHVI